MNQKTYKILISSCIVLLVGILLISGVMIIDHQGHTKYQKYIKSANSFFVSGDYDNAIIHYKEAVELNDKDEAAYIGLANSYIQKNDYQTCISYLTQGYERTNSSTLKKMLNDCLNIANGSDEFKYALNDVLNNSAGVILSENNLNKLISYNLDDFNSRYQRTGNANGDKVEYTDLGEVTYSGKKPVSIELSSLDNVFDSLVTGVSYERMTQLRLQDLDTGMDEKYGMHTVHFTYGKWSVIIESDENGNIVKKEPFVLLVNKLLSSNSSSNDNTSSEVSQDKRVVKGQVISEKNNKPLADIKIKIFKGTSADRGDLAIEQETDDEGQYRVELSPGEYSVDIVLEGYISYHEDISVEAGSGALLEDFLLTPEDINNQPIRIVLTWGTYPQDIDSHLIGVSSSDQEVHCYYGNRVIYDLNSDGGEPLITLDDDKMHGNGTEVTTIYDVDGDYSFYVDRYSSDGELAASGARVQIYTSETADPIVLDISPDFTGRTWHVCDISGGNVNIVNEEVDLDR